MVFTHRLARSALGSLRREMGAERFELFVIALTCAGAITYVYVTFELFMRGKGDAPLGVALAALAAGGLVILVLVALARVIVTLAGRR
jgi:uncharacterized integral membrane protein